MSFYLDNYKVIIEDDPGYFIGFQSLWQGTINLTVRVVMENLLDGTINYQDVIISGNPAPTQQTNRIYIRNAKILSIYQITRLTQEIPGSIAFVAALYYSSGTLAPVVVFDFGPIMTYDSRIGAYPQNYFPEHNNPYTRLQRVPLTFTGSLQATWGNTGADSHVLWKGFSCVLTTSAVAADRFFFAKPRTAYENQPQGFFVNKIVPASTVVNFFCYDWIKYESTSTNYHQQFFAMPLIAGGILELVNDQAGDQITSAYAYYEVLGNTYI